MKEVTWRNLKFAVGERDDVLQYVTNLIESGEKLFVVTANATILDLYSRDGKYRECVERSRLLTVDGIGAALLVKKVSGVKPPRYPGVEMVEDICEIAQSKGWNVFLLGGKRGVAQKAADVLRRRYPSLRISGTMHGYFEASQSASVAERIRSSRTDILFVAMGVPKQEFFICDHLFNMDVKLAVGVGGALDVISGEKKRAPKIVQKMGMEWLYRIALEPRKRARTLFSVMRFAMRLWKEEIV